MVSLRSIDGENQEKEEWLFPIKYLKIFFGKIFEKPQVNRQLQRQRQLQLQRQLQRQLQLQLQLPQLQLLQPTF